MGLDISGFGSVADLAGGLLDRFWPKAMTGEEKAKIKIEMQKVLEERENTVLKAKENILVQELKQSDNFTKRARPSVIYAGLAFIALNHVIMPIVAWIILMYTGKSLTNLPVLTLPAEFWWSYTGIISTYSIGRTMEKKGTNNKIISMITGGK